MNYEFKTKLANLTIGIIAVTVAIVVIWFIILIVSDIFDLNVFVKQTGDIFYIFLFAALTIVTCSAFLNVSLNIGLIAEAKMRESNIEPTSSFSHKYYLGFFGIVIFLVALLFLGDQFSRYREKEYLLSECQGLITHYQKSIDIISAALEDSTGIEEIPAILSFLSCQKEDFDDIAIIIPTKFSGQLTFLRIGKGMNSHSFSQSGFDLPFYPSNERDSEYLGSVFEGNNTKPFVWSERNKHYIYYPVSQNNACYVIHFTTSYRYDL